MVPVPHAVGIVDARDVLVELARSLRPRLRPENQVILGIGQVARLVAVQHVDSGGAH
jgi:hypothetical protein